MNHISKGIGVTVVALLFFSAAFFAGTAAYAQGDYDFNQCWNDSALSSLHDGIIDACQWTTGAINQVNSKYTESDGVPHRFLFTHNEPHTTHTATFQYDFTKSSVYGYDFIVDVDHTTPLSLLNPCGNLPPFISGTICQNVYANAVQVVVPDDPFDSVPAHLHPYGPGLRHILFGCDHNGTNTCSNISITSITHVPATTCFKDCGDSSVQITMQWDAPANETAYVGMWFAGELASAADPDGAGGAIGWGTGCGTPPGGCGASSAPGASYHMALISIDGDSIGGQDTSILIGGTSGHNADLQVTKTCPGTVTAGNNIVYTIKVKNNGPDTATSVYMDDTLPSGVTWISTSTSQGTCDDPTGSPQVIHCDIDFMQPGDEETITIVVNVPGGTANGTVLTNSATVGGAVTETNTANNTDTCETTVNTPTGGSVDVSVDKTCPGSDVVAGGANFDYTITVTNNSGSTDATSVTLTDSLPGGVTFVSSTPGSPICTESGGIVTCDLGTITAGSHVDVTITVQANPSTRGTITNTASVALTGQTNTSESSSDSCETNVVGQADLSITKPCQGTVHAGSEIDYTITVHNDGPSTATDTQVVDTLPTGVTFVSATSSQGSGCTYDGVVTVTCDLGTIAPSGSATITLTVQVNIGTTGSISNTASVSSAETDPDPDNNTSAACSTTVTAPVAVPALTDWGMLIFIILAGMISVYYLRRQRKSVSRG
jgi:uncharacterized repeat protein (TIGR01451 family)